MNDKIKPTGGFDAALQAVRRYLMEQGNRFDRGPAYEGDGKVLSSVKQTVRMYESMGYVTLMEFGDPPVYAVLERGRREAHIFQPQDPKIQEWLADDAAVLNDSVMRAYMLQQSGLTEKEVPVAAKPRHFHINEVDNVFIATTEEGD